MDGVKSFITSVAIFPGRQQNEEEDFQYVYRQMLVVTTDPGGTKTPAWHEQKNKFESPGDKTLTSMTFHPISADEPTAGRTISGKAWRDFVLFSEKDRVRLECRKW